MDDFEINFLDDDFDGEKEEVDDKVLILEKDFLDIVFVILNLLLRVIICELEWVLMDMRRFLLVWDKESVILC